MRPVLDRLSASLVGWVPDLSRIPARRQAVVAAILSLVVHLLILLVLLGATLVFPEKREARVAAPEEPRLTLQVVPPKPERAVVPAFEEHRQIIDPRGLQASAQKPDEAKFESDRDMKEGSEKPPTGDLPIPSTDGRTDRPTHDFATKEVQLTLKDPQSPAADAPPTPPQPAATVVATEPAPATPSEPAPPPPLYEPRPVSRTDLANSQQAPPDRALPEPARPTRATPPPLPKVVTPKADQIAVMTPPEQTEPGPITRLQPPSTPLPVAATPVPTREMAHLTPPKLISIPKASDRYQEQIEKTRNEGSLSNKGPAGVAAVATPAGRWWMQSKNAIGQNWYLLNDVNRYGMSPGSVKVTFAIDARGKLQDVRVDARTGSANLVDICLEALRRTAFPPPPAEVIEPFRDHKIENTITFNYF